MKKKKFSFLDLDDDNFVEKNFGSKNEEKNRENEELKKAQEEVERIDREAKERKTEKDKALSEHNRKILEQNLLEEAERIRKSEKESIRIQAEHERKKLLKSKLESEDRRLQKMEEAAKQLKRDYVFEKAIATKTKELQDNKIEYSQIANDEYFEIESLFSKSEKLYVKTNIYLRKDLYERVTRICKETGRSRSAIINKMIEIALKKTLN